MIRVVLFLRCSSAPFPETVDEQTQLSFVYAVVLLKMRNNTEVKTDMNFEVVLIFRQLRYVHIPAGLLRMNDVTDLCLRSDNLRTFVPDIVYIF